MAVALFGGTFNPVHVGHLRIATELAELLPVSKIKMMPSGYPPHRGNNLVAAEHRLKMLKVAIGDNNPLLAACDIELQRASPSYSIDTLRILRAELGPDTSLILCLGMDAFIKINTWHEWHKLLDFCHIAVSSRPDYNIPSSGPLYNWIEQNKCKQPGTLDKSPAGKIFFCELTMLPISSSSIREKVAQGKSIQFMTPDNVLNYINQNRLYE
ncbi:MAG: nicotinate-nucleotide adenylyltransferase [Porticoccaceae bacterium]|nr:nicotinate-nucleotide adenylyltransferase [Porticoccaceae bacterium]